MVNKQTDPVAWALLLYELDDAQDGIKSLLRDIAEDKEFDEIAFQMHMAHIYGHLNRAWNGRNSTAQWHDEKPLPNEWNEFPTDLNPASPLQTASGMSHRASRSLM